MSVMSHHLGQRSLPSSVVSAASASSLADMTRGTRATVAGIATDSDAATARRLFDLGFAPGAEVEMLRRAPMADPVIFRVAGYDIALRRAHARLVRVATS